jgi:hypothetical protein
VANRAVSLSASTRRLHSRRSSVSATVAALTREEGDVASLAGRLWADLTGGEPQRPRVRVLLEVMALALTRTGSYRRYAVAAVRDWVAPIAEALVRDLGEDPASAEARATLLVSGMRGLALDRFVTGDDARTDRAAAVLIAAATRLPGALHDGPEEAERRSPSAGPAGQGSRSPG